MDPRLSTSRYNRRNRREKGRNREGGSLPPQDVRHQESVGPRAAKKDDSAEVYIGEDFVAVLFREDEDGEVSYQFQMAILDVDLEEA